MISRTVRCVCQLSVMRAARTLPIPGTSRRRAGVASITSNTSSPNAATNCFAKCGPMPFTRPEAR